MSLGRKYGIDAFQLFCAYHLGITEDGGYRFQNVHDVAKRFGVPSGVIKQMVQEFGMDSETIIHSSFDMAGAQVDVMTAPEGVSRVEIARAVYEEYCRAPRKTRDWRRELERDARENERVFGRRGEPRGR